MEIQLFETHSQILVIDNDIFVSFAKFLYSKYGFKELDTFYNNSKKFKLDLNNILNDYYEALDEYDKKKQNTILFQIVILVDHYYMTFVNYTNIYYSNTFRNYFIEKKSNISDLNNENNGNFVVSKVQEEWELRIRNLDNYYNYIFTENNNSITKPISYIQKIIDYFKFFKNVNTHLLIEN